MCISRQHLTYLVDRNEEDYERGNIGYETHVRFVDQSTRCETCTLLDNGRQGDMMEECRLRILRFFIAGRRDDERRLSDQEVAG
ncbi:MAG: hypothetical protein P1V51_03945 [Deltaproteobacteria bacterium]|nr:hypothetical protein [Deltaproteobacteria bacterium]